MWISGEFLCEFHGEFRANFDGGKLQPFVPQKTMQFEQCFPTENPPPNSPLSWRGVLGVSRGVSPGGVLGRCPGVVSWGGILGWCPGVVSWSGVLGDVPGLVWGECLGCPGMLSWAGVLGGVLGWGPGVMFWGGVLGRCPGWCLGVVS